MVNLVMWCASISCDNVIKWKTYLISIVYFLHINSNVIKPAYSSGYNPTSAVGLMQMGDKLEENDKYNEV